LTSTGNIKQAQQYFERAPGFRPDNSTILIISIYYAAVLWGSSTEAALRATIHSD